MKHCILTLSASLLLAQSATAAIIFEDSFENPPDVAGENPVGWNVSHTAIVVTDARASQGSQSLFIRDGGPRLVTQASPVSIPGGGQDLLIEFDFALNSSTETGEGLIAFDIDLGSGFETVINDEGQANGYADVSAYSGSTITLPNAGGGNTAFFSYAVTVPASYYGSASEISLRFTTNSSVSAENFNLDNVSISTVPEPSAYALMLGLSTLGLLVYRRRQ